MIVRRSISLIIIRENKRIRIQALVKAGLTIGQTSVAIGFSDTTVRKWKGKAILTDNARSGRLPVLDQWAQEQITELMNDKWGASLRRTLMIMSNSPTNQTERNSISLRTIQRCVQSTPWGKIAYKPKKTFILTTINFYKFICLMISSYTIWFSFSCIFDRSYIHKKKIYG